MPAKKITRAAFTLGQGVERAYRVLPYERKLTDPVYRPLRIFALDPSASRLHGNVARVDVPYEPLLPGPQGQVFEVDAREFDAEGDVVAAHRALDLEDARYMLAGGIEPTQSDPRFHAQMVYAVCATLYQRFKEALGRSVAWGFAADDSEDTPLRLRLKPLGVPEENAYYDPDTGELIFGFYPADAKATVGRNLPRGSVFTCLGHDIVAHECTHALLDGLRAHFTTTTHIDVAAFHEGFADIVALLQRFSHKDVVREALRASRGRLDVQRLTGIGQQFGETSGDFGPIRNAIDYTVDEKGKRTYQVTYDKSREAHDRGRILCAAVYEAFVTIYDRKRGKYMRMATAGSGYTDPRNELPSDLLEVLTDLARSTAGQFLNMCIRAIDYCPPVDIRFGDYLRAVITADREMVPDDPHGYREAWIDAFQQRKVYPDDVPNLGEDALVWRPPLTKLPTVDALSFAELAFDGDPGRVPRRNELRRQATEIGKLVTHPDFMSEFGLVDPEGRKPAGVEEVGIPSVQSVRVARRVGPDSTVAFDLVAEVTQRVVRRHKGKRFELYGGATVLIGPWGNVTYVIRKRAMHEYRDAQALDFITSLEGRTYWNSKGAFVTPRRAAFKLVHKRRRGA